MARTVPWYQPRESVYHNNSTCEAGRQIQPQDRCEGTAGKRLCPECMVHNAIEIPAST